MDGQSALHEFTRRVHADLHTVPVLDPIPPQWLHLTTQDVGFTDEIGQQDLETVGAAVSRRVAGLGPIHVRFGPLAVDAEGISLTARPVPELTAVRAAIRDVIAEVRGADRVPGAADGWWAHVSLAYANADGVSQAPIRDIVNRHQGLVPATFTRVSLIELNRDEGMYQWRTVIAAPLTG
ncbi:2'-5' RNA ligase family protein [Thermopolyspora sp. NPDC052614]|uniref:2'-5' RNA ligase family protein n=1 Tax=Thermopolyspora sp. NPDC052614 TaxID=3155682 RepID=UPI0034184629